MFEGTELKSPGVQGFPIRYPRSELLRVKAACPCQSGVRVETSGSSTPTATRKSS